MTWEYIIREYIIGGKDQEWNRLGAEGWELVAVVGNLGNRHIGYFKRPKRETTDKILKQGYEDAGMKEGDEC